MDEDEEAEDLAPTAEGDDGEDDSSEDEKLAPEDDGDEHQAKRQACLARLGALVGTQIQVCIFWPFWSGSWINDFWSGFEVEVEDDFGWYFLYIVVK